MTTTATFQGEVRGDRAFGIDFSSRYDRAIEIAEMLRFASLANSSGLADAVRKLWYDSKSCVCVVELAGDVPPRSDVDGKPFLIATLTLDQFIWRPDVDDGNDEIHPGGDRDYLGQCDLASVALVFPPDGWYRATVDYISPLRADGSRSARFVVSHGPHAGDMVYGQVMDPQFAVDDTTAWLWIAQEGRRGESRRDPAPEAIGRECVVQTATKGLPVPELYERTIVSQTVVRLLPVDHPDIDLATRVSLELPHTPGVRRGDATESDGGISTLPPTNPLRDASPPSTSVNNGDGRCSRRWPAR